MTSLIAIARPSDFHDSRDTCSGRLLSLASRHESTGDRMSEPGLSSFNRRAFLNHTLQALGALTLAPLADSALGADTAGAPVASAAATLTAAEYVALDAVADALIPHGGAFDLGARDVNLARRIGADVPKLQPQVALGFRGALAFTEGQAPALAGKKAPFSALSEADRTAVLSAMLAAGGLPALVFLSLKAVCITHFYTLDATWKFTGYDGPMLLEDAK
jgi:hypothetical protein